MKITCFGELMLRLKSPGAQRLLQENRLEATFGGAESNVAMCLANWGVPTAFVTLLPDQDLGRAAIRALRAAGVDTSGIPLVPGRLGLYFVEGGAGDRPSRVLYDRADSCISRVKEGDLDWEKLLEGSDLLHLTGITPAISQSAAEETLRAAKTARAMGVILSCDLNFRSKLFQYGKTPPEVLLPLAELTDILIANEAQFAPCLGLELPVPPEEGAPDPAFYQDYTREVLRRFPQVRLLAVTRRRSLGTNRGTWAACLADGKDFALSSYYEFEEMVDRVGSGDAFTAGLLYSLHMGWGVRDAVEYAMASGSLKHTIPGDFNLVTPEEVLSLTRGRSQANVQR